MQVATAIIVGGHLPRMDHRDTEAAETEGDLFLATKHTKGHEALATIVLQDSVSGSIADEFKQARICSTPPSVSVPSVSLWSISGAASVAAIAASLLMSPRSALANDRPPTLDEVFQSVQGSMKSDTNPDQLIGFGLCVLALLLMIVAVKFWSQKRAAPTPLRSQKKLMNEAARAVGISKAQMKHLQPLAEEEGLSSPLVAVICPSVLKRLAARAKTEKQRTTITDLARAMSKSK
jgi:hypothetical protein